MQWQQALNKAVAWSYMTKLRVFNKLREIETIKVRTNVIPLETGFDAKVWQRDGNFYFFTVEELYNFPEDMAPPESSTTLTPAAYVDVMETYLALTGYVERLNTGEQKPNSFRVGEGLVVGEN